MLAFLKILFLSMAAAISYGIVQDQITARICVAYFTIGHPPIFATDDPTWLALGWGILASWWVGVLLGVPLALVARLGSRPKLTAHDLLKPVAVLMLMVGFAALVAGIVGFLLAYTGAIWLIGPLAVRVPAEQHIGFLADAWAHTTAYAAGFLGGLGVLGWVHRERQRRTRRAEAERTPADPFPFVA